MIISSRTQFTMDRFHAEGSLASTRKQKLVRQDQENTMIALTRSGGVWLVCVSSVRVVCQVHARGCDVSRNAGGLTTPSQQHFSTLTLPLETSLGQQHGPLVFL